MSSSLHIEPDSLIRFRRDLHTYPELSNHESETAEKVLDQLRHTGATKITPQVGGEGIIAEFASGRSGPNILIRGDMDALPIQEVGDTPHKSRNEGVAHMCGHDGHTIILLGLAQELTEDPIERGKVFLLFQPGEENGTGAKAMLADEKFIDEPIDYAFALHNLPGYELHRIVTRRGAFNAHVNSLVLKLNGKTAHAAEPEQGHNPSLAMSEILSLCASFHQPDTGRDDFYLITPVYATMGSPDYGISAGFADVRLTIRSWTIDVFEKQSAALQKSFEKICEKHHLNLEASWTHEFFANQNDDKAVDYVEASAKAGNFELEERPFPFKWGEDFGLFTQKFKGCMFGIGSGVDCPALHNPDYDFPDEILLTAIGMFNGIIREALKD